MKFNVDAPTLRPWLRAVEPSLPMLATRAAVELDALRRGSPGSMDAVQELSELLKNSFDQEYENEGTHRSGSLLDPSTMVLVGRALETIPDKRVTKVSDVQEMMREVAVWLDASAANAGAQHAEVLRDFCLALARGASSHHRDFRDEGSTHPYCR
ncbi:MAG: hypothetical protein HY301_11330 [Verrucomicrobia bacterium]|nr:hypothetical protein [Verrucomicrobiota bacterium]